MGGFMEEARASAAREFGARHYRSFAAVASARRLAPVLAGIVVTTGVVAAGFWVAGNWGAWTSTAGDAGSRAAGWLVPVLVVTAAVAGVVGLAWAGSVVWRRHGWRWRRFT